MMAELLPCPFCGSGDVHITGAYPHYVYCLNCVLSEYLIFKSTNPRVKMQNKTAIVL